MAAHASSDRSHASSVQHETLLGHPVGLYTLFFAEMWERFSYYGMRALLLFYMLKGFLGYGDSDAYTVYGAYTALVYMTPFFGGMIADRLLGPRRAVVLGGLFMAAGHLMMTIENSFAFFTALALLIAGNGFFKPNISTIVGSLYPPGSPKRDGGFTIFYMGINLGAAMSPLLCGYIGETYGWHRGFGLATIGMLTGIAVFVAPSITSQLLMAAVTLVAAFVILDVPQLISADSSLHNQFNLNYLILGVLACLIVAGLIVLKRMGREQPAETGFSRLLLRLVIMATALGAAYGLFRFGPDNIYSQLINYFVAIALLIAAVVAWIALGQGGLPANTGAPPDEAALRRRIAGIPAEWLTYLGALLSVPVLAMFVSGFAPLNEGRAFTIVDEASITRVKESGPMGEVLAVVLQETSKPAGLILFLSGLGGAGLSRIAHRQARPCSAPAHVCRLHPDVLLHALLGVLRASRQLGQQLHRSQRESRHRQHADITSADVGSTITIQPTQEQLGFSNGGRVFTIDQLATMRDANTTNPGFTVDWTVSDDNVGMLVAERNHEIPASWFQSINPVYILVFGLVFTALWGFLGQTRTRAGHAG